MVGGGRGKGRWVLCCDDSNLISLQINIAGIMRWKSCGSGRPRPEPYVRMDPYTVYGLHRLNRIHSKMQLIVREGRVRVKPAAGLLMDRG